MAITFYYIYKHTSRSTTKSYIGVTINLNRRWIVHTSSARTGSSLHFHRAIRKYGENDWDTEILCMSKNEDDAYWLEKHFIDQFNTIQEGYNMSEGGKKTPTLRGKNHPRFGKPKSLEERRKISANHANRSGKNNTNAKHIWLQSPDEVVYKTYGSLKQFCKTHHLAWSTVCRQLKQGIKPTRGSFIGWEVWFPAE